MTHQERLREQAKIIRTHAKWSRENSQVRSDIMAALQKKDLEDAECFAAGAEAIDEVAVLRERVGELEAQAAGRRCTQCAMAASFMAGGGGDGGEA